MYKDEKGDEGRVSYERSGVGSVGDGRKNEANVKNVNDGKIGDGYIYSRPHIRIPKIQFFRNSRRTKCAKSNNNQNRKLKIARMFLILVIAFSTLKLILDAVLPLFDDLCADKAKSIATIISNEEATAVMKDHTYDELFTIEKDSSGNVKMIKSNVIAINEIISDVPNRIQEKIDERGRENVEIALGTFTGIRMLAGRGPRNKNYNIFYWKCGDRFA